MHAAHSKSPTSKNLRGAASAPGPSNHPFRCGTTTGCRLIHPYRDKQSPRVPMIERPLHPVLAKWAMLAAAAADTTGGSTILESRAATVTHAVGPAAAKAAPESDASPSLADLSPKTSTCAERCTNDRPCRLRRCSGKSPWSQSYPALATAAAAFVPRPLSAHCPHFLLAWNLPPAAASWQTPEFSVSPLLRIPYHRQTKIR